MTEEPLDTIMFPVNVSQIAEGAEVHRYVLKCHLYAECVVLFYNQQRVLIITLVHHQTRSDLQSYAHLNVPSFIFLLSPYFSCTNLLIWIFIEC